MNVKLYKFSKKTNSTKQPTAAELLASVDGNIVNGVNILSPLIKFMYGGVADVFSANYAKIDGFNDRYYFVKNWNYDSGFWTAELEVDTLATYKDDIADSTQYVTRAASESDGDIIDDAAPLLPEVFIKPGSYATNTMWHGGDPITDATSFHYVIGVVNDEPTNSASGLTYYACTKAGIDAIREKLFSSGEQVQSANEFFKPTQYIKFARYFQAKIQPSSSQVFQTEIHIGPVQITGGVTSQYIVDTLPQNSVYELGKTSVDVDFTVPIALATDINGAALPNYMQSSYASSLVFEMPCIGTVALQVDDFINCNFLYLRISVDLTSGNAIAYFSTSAFDVGQDWHRTNIINVNIGADVQLTEIDFNAQRYQAAQNSITANAAGMAAGVVGSVATIGASIATAATGAAIPASIAMIIGGLSGLAGSVASGAQGIQNAELSAREAAKRYSTTYGAYTGFSSAGYDLPRVTRFFQRQKPIDANVIGKPLYKSKKISTLSGFFKVQNPIFESEKALDTEAETIRRYLQMGCFYE